jgi:murein DD-endopeptidase MepM/ murein hydrolase activator NlpD
MRRGYLATGLAQLFLTGCGEDIHGKAVSYAPVAPHPVEVVMPANAPFLSQQFSPRQEDVAYVHYGIDVRGKAGTPVIAAAPGRVAVATFDPMHGNQVRIDHGIDSDGQRVMTTYHHLSRVLVEEGAEVARGQRIGVMGSTGLSALMNHLHFEIRRGPDLVRVKAVDPQLMWTGGVGRVSCFDAAGDYPRLPLRITYPAPCRSGA